MDAGKYALLHANGMSFHDVLNLVLHDAAEKIRVAPVPDHLDDYSHFTEVGADWAADLIDPEV